jgi:glycosyltransferase involved in cell wall biosynthesis
MAQFDRIAENSADAVLQRTLVAAAPSGSPSEFSPSLLSIIIPVYNEQENVLPLHERLTKALRDLDVEYEVILVNDGSTDATEAKLKAIAATDPRFKVVNFRRNFGQTAAMMAGFDFASGEIIIPLDGDLQNDPADIPRLLEKLDEGYDVVSGWRRERQDAAIRRNLPSRMANWLISRISGVRLHDYGCSLKAYRRSVLKGVRLYGEMHRFIPIYATWQGGRVTEIPVNHLPRVSGQSKYGLERVVKVVLDLIVVKFLASYANKPIYVFGGFGLFSIAVSFLSGLWALYLKLVDHVSFISTPLPLLVVLAFITGIMSILMGLIAEIIMRTYYESQGKQVYLVKGTINLPDERGA